MTARELNDPEWTAFQYAAGELTGEQRADFEATLEVDETAQHSLAQTVGLLLAIRGAQAAEVTVSPGGSGRSGWKSRRSLLRFAGCLAASAAVLVAGWFAQRGPVLPPEVPPQGPGAEDPVQLAIMWNETRSTLQEQEEWSPGVQPVEETLTPSEPRSAEEDPDTWSVSETPPWVWAAIGADLTGADQEPSADNSANLGEI